MSDQSKSWLQNGFSMDWWVERLKKIPCSGIVLGVLSGFFLTLAGLIVKLTQHINPIEVVVSRSLVQLIVYLPICLLNGDSLLGIPGERLPLVLRGISGFFSFGTQYTAFHMIPLADVSTIILSAPIITFIMAWILLKEECGLFHTFTVFITIIGVFLIARPSFLFPDRDNDTALMRIEGTIVSIFGCFFSASNYIIIRSMPTTSASVVITVFSIIAGTMGIITLAILQNCIDAGFMSEGIVLPTDSFTILCLIGNGICGVLGQLCLVIALKLEEAGLISLARTLDVVIAFVFQVIWVPDDTIEWTSIVGAVIICLGVYLSGLRRWLKERPDKWNFVWCLLNCGCNNERETHETLPVSREDRVPAKKVEDE